MPSVRQMLPAAACIYLIVGCVVSAFVFRTFGAKLTAAISLLLLLPFAILVRMLLVARPIRLREAAYLTIVILCVVVAVPGMIMVWKDSGLDRYHAEDLSYAAFAESLHRDSKFNGVTLTVEGYHVLYACGTVESQSEIDRLVQLAKTYKIRLNNKLRIEGK